MADPIRRVVTGHDETGRAMVILDGPAKTYELGQSGMTLFDVWRTADPPEPVRATEADPVEAPLDFNIPRTGVRLRYLDYPPADPGAAPFMHRTASVDFAVVVSGEMTMLMDDSEVVLNAGDVVVQRGTNHAWVNRSGRLCRMLFVIIGAEIAPELEAQFRPQP
jgi:mannose-6-phosphate isomerase-like protein (cupin superfamily)